MTSHDAHAYATHEVLNQPPPLADYDAFATDGALRSIVATFAADWAVPQLHEAGQTVGSAKVQELARQADQNPPELRTHDRFGNRIDRVDFHPAWHELMRLAIGQGAHALCWTDPRPGAQVARAALSYLWSQGENGIGCPIGMTYSAVPVLRRDPARWAEWGRLVTSTTYDPRQIRAADKSGATVGVAMTEKQGGSDLRQTQTRAVPNGDGSWSLIGHKWFFSVPHSDLFLTLARTEAGVSCFVVAGWLPDGSRNRLHLQRLKNKCGNRSNASAEVEFRGAVAHLLGEPGRGIATGLAMNHFSRLECALSSAGLIRQAVAQAAHHTVHRRAFHKALIDQPLMTNVVADLALEAEAATWLAFRCAAALDREAGSEAERLLARIGTPIAKYWVCKRAPAVVAEALECHGGNGFIEDHLVARLYREAPLNGVWEGSGNVICLDVLRTVAKEPGSVTVLLDEMRTAKGADRRYAAFLNELEAELAGLAHEEGQARRLVGRLALAASASLLLRHAPHEVGDAFVASRLSGGWSGHLGNLPPGVDTAAIARRAIQPR